MSDARQAFLDFLNSEMARLYHEADNWKSTYDVPRGSVKIYAPGEVVPSIKYGEHKWGGEPSHERVRLDQLGLVHTGRSGH